MGVDIDDSIAARSQGLQRRFLNFFSLGNRRATAGSLTGVLTSDEAPRGVAVG